MVKVCTATFDVLWGMRDERWGIILLKRRCTEHPLLSSSALWPLVACGRQVNVCTCGSEATRENQKRWRRSRHNARAIRSSSWVVSTFTGGWGGIGCHRARTDHRCRSSRPASAAAARRPAAGRSRRRPARRHCSGGRGRQGQK